LKNALIFGSNGQDGAYLSEFLLKKGYNVYGTFRRTSHKSLERLEELNIFDDVKKIKADVCDTTSIREAIKESQPDEIYNLAAQSFVGISFSQPTLTSDVTGLGTLNILECIKDLVPDAKFYQASSSEMFGDSSGDKNEATILKPRSPYGVAKVYAHNMTNHYREAYGLFGCCGILFNHESPLRGIEFVTRRITWNMARIKYNEIKNFTLGNIDAKRDWGFAGDYVEAMWLMLQQKKPNDYVIATGTSYSVKDFLELAAEYSGLGDWKDFVVIDEKNKRPSDIEELLGDSTKARNELNWTPKTSFKQLVKMMVDHDLDYFKSRSDPFKLK
jgi:GDPmannose 4,6-dehydratase